jgi:hypothetical protein
MPSKRRERILKERSKKRASKRLHMENPGAKSRYALKQAGQVRREYRIEGGLLLDPAYIRVHAMPGPHVIQEQVWNPEMARWEAA